MNKTTQIISCSCEHQQQDRMYGKGKRVANQCKRGETFEGKRCTVCERVH